MYFTIIFKRKKIEKQTCEEIECNLPPVFLFLRYTVALHTLVRCLSSVKDTGGNHPDAPHTPVRGGLSSCPALVTWSHFSSVQASPVSHGAKEGHPAQAGFSEEDGRPHAPGSRPPHAGVGSAGADRSGRRSGTWPNHTSRDLSAETNK